MSSKKPREWQLVANTPYPATVESLGQDLANLGVTPGMTLIVHASLSALGWVAGGAVAVIYALEAALGATGTLVMPTHSGELSDPAQWVNPPVPEDWIETIKAHMPAYNPALTPTRSMGLIAETFRKQEGTLRSSHPQLSFAARGPQAAAITNSHALDDALGETSPLARLYDLAGWVLLLGVGHGNNTSLHLAEYRADFPGKKGVENGAPVMVDNQRQWVTYKDIDLNEKDFPEIGEAFTAQTGLVRQGKVGQANATLMPQRALVDYAAEWMTTHRG